MVLWWTLAATAGAWEPAELRPADLGAVAAIATVASWDGEPGLFVGGADGLRLLEPATLVPLAILREPVAALLVQDLDGVGGPEVLACGPGGLRLVRGDRELLATRPLADAPCAAVVAERRADWPRLVSISDGRLVRWEPTSVGLARDDLDVAPADPSRLAASGWTVATVTAEGLPWLSTEGVGPAVGPIEAVAALAPAEGLAGFAWLVGGARPRVARPGPDLPLDAPATGLVAAGDHLWVLDAAGRRLGVPEGEGIRWWAAPVAPRHGARVDADGDACPDLVLADGEGAAALVIGGCGARAPVAGRPAVAPLAVPSAPAELELGEVWAVLDVRVGDTLATRLVGPYGPGGRWRSVGGPPGLAVQADGTIRFAPEEGDVGRWRVAVRHVSPERLPRWSGFELRVWPTEHTVAGPEDVQVVDRPVYPHRRRLVAVAPRATWFGLGAAGGAARSGGTTWENLGRDDLRGGASPIASLLGAWGSDTVQGLFGIDSAPFFSYASLPRDRRHALALTGGLQVGAADAWVGLYGTYGFSVRGAGARLQWTGLRDWRGAPTGLEARLLWLAPHAGAEVALLWVWSLQAAR